MEDPEINTRREVQENARALLFRYNRDWLRKTMRDPKNFLLTDDEFVDKAIKEAKADGQLMSTKTAIKLFRLFRARGSQALDDALGLYPDK